MPMKKMKSLEGNFIEMTLFFHHQTSAAILISNDGTHKKWIPKSQLLNDISPFLCGECAEVEIVIPEWLAIEKELI